MIDILKETIEVNYRSKEEATTYCKEERCYINGILHVRFFGSNWTIPTIQRYPFNLKLIRRARKQDIVVP